MDRPTGELLEHHLSPIPHLNNSFRQLGRLAGDSHDVPGFVLLRIDKKIGARQKEEMQHLIADMREDLGKLAQQASGWWNFYPETPVNGLVCGKMVLPGANSADAGDNPRDFFGCAALDKLFESPHRHYMHAGLSYIAVLVERDTYPGVTFDSSHRLNRYLSYGSASGFRNCFAHKDPFLLPGAAKCDQHRKFFLSGFGEAPVQPAVRSRKPKRRQPVRQVLRIDSIAGKRIQD